MKRKYFSIIILCSLLILQTSFVSNTLLNNLLTKVEQLEQSESQSGNIVMKSIGAGGEEQLKTNVLRNGGFEEQSAQGGAEHWYTGGTGQGYFNPSYTGYTALFSNYAGYIEAEGTAISSMQMSASRYTTGVPYPYLDEGINLNLYYLTISNPDKPIGSNVFVQVIVYSGSQSYYLNYYVSTYEPNWVGAVNSSNYGYFILDSSYSTWHNLQRDITADFDAVFGSHTASYRVYYMNFMVYSPVNPSGKVMAVIDEAKLTNATVYDYFEPNGDFEDGLGTNWDYRNNAPGYISLSQDNTEGSTSLNMSAFSIYPNGYSQAYQYSTFGQWSTPYRGYYTDEPGKTVLDFDWKYTGSSVGSSDMYTCVYFYAANDTFSFSAILLLGSSASYSPTNYSGPSYLEKYYLINGYGSNGTWNNFNFDLYDLFTAEGLVNLAIIDVEFWVIAGGHEDAFAEILLDDFKLISYFYGDPSFEQDWYWSVNEPIAGWDCLNSYPFINHTSDARTGNWAANITSYNSAGYIGVTRPDDYELSDNIFTDFSWRLDKLNAGTNYAMSYIQMRFEGNYFLRYVLAATELYLPANSSNNVYYFVDSLNQTGTWNNLVRNIVEDLDTAFGAHLWNLTSTNLYTYTDGIGAVCSVIFDDMYFIEDTHGPDITGISILNTPVYYNPVSIRVDAVDAISEVEEVLIHYLLDSVWYYVEATYNQTGGHYVGTIPAFDYSTDIYFYITAEDTRGLITIDNNGGLNYLYSIDDDIDPTISISVPVNGSVVRDNIVFNFNVIDMGSGLDQIMLYDGPINIDNINFEPDTYDVLASYEFNTRVLTNGIHTISAILYDNAGNSDSDSVTLDVQNDYTAPSISSIQLNPEEPQYDETTEVIVGIQDQSEIASVILSYKIGDQSWVKVNMSADGPLYTSNIPVSTWNTEVLYYVTAYDVYDQFDSIGSQIDPLSYIVQDSVNPELTIDGPSTSEVLRGNVSFSIDGSDIGSGIATVDVVVNETVIFDSDTLPVVFTWNTDEHENGVHQISFVLSDNAGNVKVVDFLYEVNNPKTFFPKAGVALADFFKTWGALVGAGLAGIGIGTFYFFKARKMKVA